MACNNKCTANKAPSKHFHPLIVTDEDKTSAKEIVRIESSWIYPIWQSKAIDRSLEAEVNP